MTHFSIRINLRTIRYTLMALAAIVLFAAVNTIHAAPSCNQGYTNDCLYVPENVVDFSISPNRDISYIDATGYERTISVAMREPLGIDDPMPIVIWSHGGAQGKENGLYSMEEWSDLTASMGYFTISIAHHSRDLEAQGRLCDYLGIEIPDDCGPRKFKYLSWDRPYDIRAVLDELELIAQTDDRLDMSRIAVAGHSAGAGGTMMVAGATRSFGGAPVLIDDPRPIAFLAFSPQGPGTDGFFETDFGRPETSWMDITRPVFMATGAGDNGCKPSIFYCELGPSSSNRKAPFDLMPDGDKYRMFINDTDTLHTMFELKTQKCLQLGVDAVKCQDFTDWLSSAALAFLDAHLRQDTLAALWLQSDNLEQAGSGSIEWSMK